jgi:hypothetical protein
MLNVLALKQCLKIVARPERGAYSLGTSSPRAFRCPMQQGRQTPPIP